MDNPEYGDKLFHDAICDMLVLVDSCEKAIRRNPDMNQDVHLRHLGRVKKGILGVSEQHWREFRENFSDDFLGLLEVLGTNMSYHWREEVIPEEELADIQLEVEELTDRVLSSSLDDQLRMVLVDGLEEVRSAIVAYRTLGAEGIRSAVDRNLASFFRYFDDFEKVPDGKDRETIIDIGKFIRTLDTLTSAARKLQPALSSAAKFLPLPGMGADD